MTEYLNQYEACDKILEHLISNPTKWFSPSDIQKIYLRSGSIEKLKHLFDLMAYTQQPSPASFQRSLSDSCWNIKMNDYTKEFLTEGGFTAKYNEILEESRIESEKTKLEIENLKLQNENLKYQQTIRDQEKTIRDLVEQNGFFQLLKNYWWLIVTAFALGGIIGKFFWS
ncbi:hypothetical protein SYJ56_04815 [Algoriphagus sp. D3-2-R+10]|uniref:hypothetical protein n=1 Tax=Algoriphagus aurantiacus TaxID=3103948 RepID=UPI002B3D29FF|nr:hypothetical protein [Algoriphagus sp. D3-2-R+10]MEB2774615.1 hypothetical protein [Algoriphagus sp. D3-2-R+10]